MASVKLENTREHDITLSVADSKSGVTSVTVPASKQDPEDKKNVLTGTATADDSFLAEARKNPIVQHYFKQGWIRVVRDEKKTAQTDDK